jgi:hypothetical protein
MFFSRDVSRLKIFRETYIFHIILLEADHYLRDEGHLCPPLYEIGLEDKFSMGPVVLVIFNPKSTR